VAVRTDVDATSPGPRARLTGTVYLFYFLTAVSDEVFIGRHQFALYEVLTGTSPGLTTRAGKNLAYRAAGQTSWGTAACKLHCRED
jgi:hypothetical protein